MHISNTCAVWLLCLVSWVGATYIRGRQWTDCTNPSSPMRVTRMSFEPRPLLLPGSLYFGLGGYSNRTVGSSRMILDIEMVGRWINIPVPCIFNIGSCTYPDMCTLLDQMINENWLGATRDVATDIKTMLEDSGMNPGMCPQQPAVLNVSPTRLRLPQIPSALVWFAEGLYHANVRVVENSSDEEIVCLDINLHVKKPRRRCSGWFGCMFSG